MRQFTEMGGRERNMIEGHSFLDGMWCWVTDWKSEIMKGGNSLKYVKPRNKELPPIRVPKTSYQETESLRTDGPQIYNTAS